MKKLLAGLFLFVSLSSQAAFLNDGWDWEARRWLTNITASSGTISGGSYMTGTRFLNQIKQWGVRPRIGRANLYLGDQTNAMLCPIIIDWRGANPDINDDLIAFVSTNYSEATGLTGNTSSKYLRPSKGTGMGIANFTGIDSIHEAVYVRTGSDQSGVVMGSVSGGNALQDFLVSYAGTTYSRFCSAANSASTADASGKGFYCSTRTATNSRVVYKNGSALITSTISAGGVLGPAFEVVHAQNNGGTVGQYTDRTLSYYGYGFGISASIQGPYRVAVRNVQVAKGRNVE